MGENNIKLIVVEDDMDFIYLIKQLANNDPEINYLGCASNKTDAIKLACEVSPNIVLMDLNLSSQDLDGIETSKQIRILTDAKIIILTSFENYDTVINACIRGFASGYIFKSQYETLLQSIKHTAHGYTPQEFLINSLIFNQLTPAEKTVLTKMIGGNADILSSNKTIANQKTNIFKKLGLKSQKEVYHIFNKLPFGFH